MFRRSSFPFDLASPSSSAVLDTHRHGLMAALAFLAVMGSSSPAAGAELAAPPKAEAESDGADAGSGGAEASEPSATEEDQQDYEQLQASLEGLTDAEIIAKIRAHLKVHASCPNREVLEAQLAQLGSATLTWQTLEDGRRILHEPLGFLGVETSQRMQARLQVGLPPWADTGLLYQHPLNERFALMGIIGGAEGLGRASVAGRAQLWSRPDHQQQLSADVELRFDAGSDSRFQVEPRLQYGQTFQKLELQAFAAARVRVNTLRVRALGGVSVGYALRERLLLSAEVGGYLRPIANAYTTKLDLAAFSYLSAGGSYLVSRSWSVSAGVSVADFFRYRQDYRFALNGQVTYRFGSTVTVPAPPADAY